MKRERTRSSLINRFGVCDGQETCIDGNILLIFCDRQRPAILKGSEYSTVWRIETPERNSDKKFRSRVSG